MSKLNLSLALFSIALLCAACATSPEGISKSKPVQELYVVKGVALEGYDAVAYFTDGKPIPGSAKYQIEWHGAQWRFATKEHLNSFISQPDRYVPQYGGYCAFAVSRGTTANGDPQQWAIVNDKLYVNNNAFAMLLWDHDRLGNIGAGDINWPLLPKRPL